MLPRTDVSSAHDFAELLRRAVATGDALIALTISAGVVAEDIPFALTRAADAALYDAKRTERDCVARALRQ